MTRLASILAVLVHVVVFALLFGGALSVLLAAKPVAPSRVAHYRLLTPDEVTPHAVDGDTLDCFVATGLNTFRKVRVRVLDIDAYELRDKPRGPDAKAFTASWLASAKGLEIVTDDDGVDSFGRILARVYDQRGRSLGADLLKAGHAEEYKR